MADLKTNYKNDILDTSKNVNRKYRMVDNGDGTYSFEDVTEYLQVGDTFGAGDLNNITGNLTASNGKSFRFGVTDDGEYGYIMPGEGGADTVIPFSNAKDLYDALQYSGLVTPDMTFDEMCEALAEYFPNMVYDTQSTWTAGQTSVVGNESSVVRSGNSVILKGDYSEGNAHRYYTNNVPIANYNKMKIAGVATFSTSAIGYSPILTIKVGGTEVLKNVYTTLPTNKTPFEVEVDANANIEVIVDVSYCQYTIEFDVQLFNGGNGGGEIVDAVLVTKTITANGTYKASDDNADGYSEITVNVPTDGGEATLIEKEITENGEYDASDEGADGYKSVSVNVPDKYEQGKEDERRWFWETYQDGGKRTNYTYAFCNSYWTDDLYHPIYDIDISNKPQNSGGQYLFVGTRITDTKVTVIANGASLSQAFMQTGSLKTVRLIVDENTTYGNTNDWGTPFYSTSGLENFYISGTIAKNYLNLKWSTKLNKDSIIRVVNCLSATTTGLTITFSKASVNNAFETSEGLADGSTSTEWLALVATKENWTIALA